MTETQLHQGDCLEVMPTLPANSVDSIVCDPPYGLSFMGKHWDHGVPGPAFWEAALRVVKPGAMLLAFGGSRTFHRLTCAIEDAGWEIRDCLMWLYGSGFPKSLDISKAIDKAAGAEREKVRTPITAHSTAGKGISNELDERPWLTEARKNGYHEHDGPIPATPAAQQWAGFGTALKPAWEPVILAMKPVEQGFAHNALKWGVAGLNIDQCRIGSTVETWPATRSYAPGQMQPGGKGATQPTGNVPAGRWPANLILDEESAALLDEQSGIRPSSGRYGESGNGQRAGMFGLGSIRQETYFDTGGASRFFYCTKASRRDRNEGLEGMTNIHNTVKPTDLMRYLVRLVTPRGGTVLDPFMGSGSTGKAAKLEGFDFVGIEWDAEYLEIARRRIEAVHAQLPLAMLE